MDNLIMEFNKYIKAIIIMLIIMTGCEEKWQDHYDKTPETVDQNVWDVIQDNPDMSLFVDFMKQYQYDTLFLTDNPYTLFVPTNDAVTEHIQSDSITASVLDYHISVHFIQSTSIEGKRKIQTLAEKFALLDNSGSSLLFDDIVLDYESPLYRNGKYFTMQKVGQPRPNIYEFFAANNPILKDYIDAQDSIIVDRERSRAIGFDEEGNTVYDTVAIIYNEFEEEYFPVREEFRNRTATIVFPREDEYNEALTNMATYLGTYQDYREIPLEWQNKILIPYLLENGVFENMIEEVTFITPTNRDTVKMKNILGDSINIDYQVDDKFICSNGYVYSYANFQIPDTLYKGSVKFEAENLVREVGINRFAWRESARVFSDLAFTPQRDFSQNASNDSLLRVSFPPNYTGAFSLEFKIINLFPRKYVMVMGTNINLGGVYDIYVNDELVKTFDWAEYQRNFGLLWSVTGKWRYIPRGTYNKFDAFVDNRAEYGETTIRFVYKEPGNVLHKGLTIDNLEFIPYDF